MALLDRFRTQPRHKHSDPAVRLAYVEELRVEERDRLAGVAREDEDPRVRRAAVAKLMDPAALALVAREERDERVREQAIEMLRDIALEAFEALGEGDSVAAVDGLSDAKVLAHVAKMTARESVGLRAVSRIREARALTSVARSALLDVVRRAALDGISGADDLLAVAVNSEFKDAAVTSVERLSTRAQLEQVAERARNKAAAKRARALLREMDARVGVTVSTPSTPTGADVRVPADAGQRPRTDRAEARGSREEAERSREEAQRSREQAERSREEAQRVREAGERALGAARARREECLAAVEALSGTSSAAELARWRDEWRRLAPLPLAAETAAFNHRFEQAARACERRDREWKNGERVRGRLTELADAAEAAALDADLPSAHGRLAVVLREWTDLSTGATIDSDIAVRVASAEARVAARDAEAREQRARLGREALGQLELLVKRVEPLAEGANLSSADGARALRDIRAAITEVSPLVARKDAEAMMRRLKAAQARLAARVQEMREADDWKHFANLGMQEQLCARMEALAQTTEPSEALAQQIRDLQQQWRQVADVPRGPGEALWRRFKAAHDVLWPRCEAYFALQAAERAENLAKKTALVERAEALATSTAWIETAEAIKRLQAEWKTVGPASRGQERAVWERFRAACDRFFIRRQHDLAERKAMWADNLTRKEALCTQAEALAESTNWEQAAADIKRLQTEWKTIGPVKRSRSEAIWQRFRGAGDRFFTRYAQRHDTARAERLAAREAICVDLERLAGLGVDQEGGSVQPPPDLVEMVRGIRSRWQREIAARGLAREAALAIERRFDDAFERVVSRWPSMFARTDLDPEENRGRLEALVRRIEGLAASLADSASAEPSVSPSTRLASMLKEALAANTIGGKAEEENRGRTIADELRQAQSTFSRIGPMPDAARRALGERFERASRRILDRYPINRA